MNWLLYVAHGAECFRQEAVYSLLSWLRLSGIDDAEALAAPGLGSCAVVVTDEPESFRRYLGQTPRIRYVQVTREQLLEWRGGADGYVHRIKPLAILHAAEVIGMEPDDNLLFVDSDTAFQVDAQVLFERIAAGGVLLNELEGRLSDLRSNTKSHRRLHDAVRERGAELGAGQPIRLDVPLWNSGIIGLKVSQLGLIREALPLIDRFWAALQRPTSEQVALSVVLQRHGIEPREVLVEVLHYHVFKEFRADIEAFFAHHAGAKPEDWIRLSSEIEPAVRIQPKLAFNRLPKWRRNLRKLMGRRWAPLPYPWAASVSSAS